LALNMSLPNGAGSCCSCSIPSTLQRVGLTPDVAVRPTIKGLRAGRDEVLERALELLRGAPAMAHEILVDLFKNRPSLAAEILVEVPS
jgi:hypothetical protein